MTVQRAVGSAAGPAASRCVIPFVVAVPREFDGRKRSAFSPAAVEVALHGDEPKATCAVDVDLGLTWRLYSGPNGVIASRIDSATWLLSPSNFTYLSARNLNSLTTPSTLRLVVLARRQVIISVSSALLTVRGTPCACTMLSSAGSGPGVRPPARTGRELLFLGVHR